MRQIEARFFKWCQGCKINPIRILEMGALWKIQWRSGKLPRIQ
jgi:hypothetical protein